MSFDTAGIIKRKRELPVGGIAIEWFLWLTAFRKLESEIAGVLTFKGVKSYIGKNCDF